MAMLRLFALLTAACATAALAIPPLPPPDPPPPPEEDYARTPPPLDPVPGYFEGLLFPPVPPAYERYGRDREEDPLGDVWEMREVSSWSGVWIRRGRSPTFDGYWTNPNGERVRAVLDIRRRGDGVIAVRHHPDGQSCRYLGTIAPDGVQVSGRYTCSWERTPMHWQAQIVRMDSVMPALLRRGR